MNEHELRVTWKKECGCFMAMIFPLAQVRREGKSTLEERFRPPLRCHHSKAASASVTWTKRPQQR